MLKPFCLCLLNSPLKQTNTAITLIDTLSETDYLEIQPINGTNK